MISVVVRRPVGAAVGGVVVAALSLAACGGGGGHTATAASASPPTTMMAMPTDPSTSTGPAVAADAVDIQNFKFGPGAISVHQGTTVTWTNKDDEAHTVFFAFDGSKSPLLVNGSNTYTKTFTTAGTFVYHCTIHPFMTGTVTVTA